MSHSSIVVPDTPLSKRAWTLQERLLSTRILHFFEEELVWCCNSVSRCQCRVDASIPLVSAFKRLDTQELRPGQLNYDLEDEWSEVVNEFTARAMTKMTDRLPALSGLASLFSQQTSQDYCAGLWGPDIPFGLLWLSDHDRAGTDPIQRYPADPHPPTWSWASIVGPVKYLARHKTQFERQNTGPALKPLLDALGVSVHRDESMPFGSAGKGVIVVTGQVLPITFQRDRNTWRPRDLVETNYTPKVEPVVIFDVLSESPRSSDTTAAQEYFLLRAATYVKGVFSSSSRENYCLLLRPALEETRLALAFAGMVFQRCGVVMNGFESERVWFEERPGKVKLCII